MDKDFISLHKINKILYEHSEFSRTPPQNRSYLLIGLQDRQYRKRATKLSADRAGFERHLE
jgi:hypothetical protein